MRAPKRTGGGGGGGSGGGKSRGPTKRATGAKRTRLSKAQRKADHRNGIKWAKAGRAAQAKARRSHHRTLTLNGVNDSHEISGDDVKLGRNKPYTRAEKPRLVLEHYLDHLPAPHATVDRASKVASWPMYLNDSIGDCTCAAIGHVIQGWTAYSQGTAVAVPDNAILKAYEDVSGYDPATGANDNGAVEQDVLNYWRKTGVAGHKIGGFAELASLDNLTLAKQALQYFGTVYLGIQVPSSAMEQFDAGEPWDFVGDWNIEGGHAVPVQYWTTDRKGEIEVVTWGQRQRMTRSFWYQYVEEAWVVFSADWLNAAGDDPDGISRAALRADFQALTGQAADF